RLLSSFRFLLAPRTALFPYTTLFRSSLGGDHRGVRDDPRAQHLLRLECPTILVLDFGVAFGKEFTSHDPRAFLEEGRDSGLLRLSDPSYVRIPPARGWHM